MIPAALAVLTWALVIQLTEGGCPELRPTKHILCYLEHVTPHFDPCVCTHLVLQTTIDKLTPQSELLKSARLLQEQNPALKLVGVASDSAESALKRRDAFAKSVANVVNKCELDGVEVSLRWGAKVPGKVQLVDFIKTVSKEFKKLDPLHRSKRSDSIYEQSDNEESKPRWSPPQDRQQKQRKTRDSDDKPSVKRIKKTDDAATSSPEETSSEEKEGDASSNEAATNHREIIVKIPSDPQVLAKNYDLKRLSKYVDFYTLASDNFTDAMEAGLTYHPSRLMGIEDILNADSLVDLLTGLGAPHDKLVLTMPATALKFTLADSKKNMPQSPSTGEPERISQAELCALMSEGTWTVERDEDLTAPYAFRKKTWVAFDDRISVSIKGKYILLRDLAGGAVASADAEDWAGKCNTTGIARTLYDTFTTIARKPREAQLVSLQEQLHESSQFSSYSGDIQLSPYRIVRVVDRQGSIHVVRKEAKTEFECSRQGYFRHPSGCNRFYRCVKFNQYSSDFTVFEYDCPAGLAFDERWEVCVWPGSLPDGGACQGSSEIAPVPRERFVCPRVEGYYADPENCRWFFACLDHIRDGVTPLTAYEFRCPFGLVFNEKLLICDWPWLVEGCGGIGTFRAHFTVGDFLEGRQRASYAQLSDVHVSGGRIENVNGGVVLGSLAGIGGAGSYASGSNILATGTAAANGYSGGVGSNGALGVTGGYAGESGAAYSGAGGAGAIGAAGVAGGYAGGVGGLGYTAGVGDSGVTYVAGVGAGGAHTAQSTLVYTGEGAAGAGAYAAGSGAGTLLGVGKAGGLAVGTHTGQATLLTGVGSGLASGYAGEGGYVTTGGAGYVAGGAGAGKSTLLYSGKLAGGAIGSGGYAIGTDSGLYSAGYENGKSTLLYNSGSTAGLGVTSGLAYGSGAHTVAVDQGADSIVTTAGDEDAYLNVAAGVTDFEAAKYGGAAVVHQPVSSVSYHGTFGQKTSVPVTFVSDAISSGHGGIDTVHTVTKPAVVSNLVNLKVTPASDAIVSGLGGHVATGYVSSTAAPVSVVSGLGGHVATGYVSSTAAPVSVVTATPAPYISTYTTPRPKTYYPVASLGVTPAITTYHRPLVSVTPTVTPAVGVHSIGYTYQQPFVKTVTPAPAVAPVHYPTVLKAPAVPFNPVQYSTPAPAVSFHYSTPAPTIVSTLRPAVSPAVQYTYQKPVVPLQPVHYSTPAPAVVFEHSTPRPFVRPVVPAVVKTPVVPVQYSTPVAPTEIHYATPKPVSVVQPVSYTYQKPIVQYSTPAPAVSFEYSTPKPIVQPVQPVLQPVHHVIQPVQPVVQPVHHVVQPVHHVVQPVQPVVQPVQPVVSYSYRKPVVPTVDFHYATPTNQFQPVSSVSYSYQKPVVPLKPVQYSAPAPAVPVAYSTPRPFVQPVQPFLGYSYPKAIVPTVYKTPVVPFNPVQYSTTTVAPTVDFHYSTPAPVPVSPVSYTYQRPVLPYKPLAPAPTVAVEYSTPKPFVQPVQPVVSYSYQKPVVPTILKTPVVPLNTIQYSTTVAPTVDFHNATPKPVPVVQPISSVSYSYQKPVVPLKTFHYSAPAPAFPVAYSTPRPFVQPVQPFVGYSYPKPIVPTVYKTPVVPFNPVQYSTTVAPLDIHYSTPKPVPVVQPVSSVSYTYQKPVVPVQPITYTTPAPAVSVHYTAPKTYVQPVQPVQPAFGYSYPKPVFPTVLKTPVVPLNTIQYSTTVAPPVDLHYSTPKPVPVVQPVSPVTYSYQKPVVPLKPIQYTTPAPAVAFEYSTPRPFVQPVQPVVSYSYQKPIVPTVYKTPVVPFNPVQYSTTVAPLDIHYSTPKPVPVVQPISSVSYTYQKPVVPVQPITYTTPVPAVSVHYTAPKTYIQPVQPVQPFVGYSYPKPVVPTVQYSTTVAPPVDLHYSTPKPVPVFQPVSPVTYSYQKPVVPLKPIQYTTPAPAVAVEYSTPKPYVQPVQPVFSYGYQKPVIPTVYKTPVVPFNPVQYSTTVAPAVDLHYSVPQPAVTYHQPAVKVRPHVPVVLKTPAVPLSPIQYTTPAPVLDYSYQGPVISSVKFGHGYEKPLVSSTVTARPAVVTSTTVVPDFHYTPMYQRVIDAFKTPVVSAYQKVLNVISGTTTPAPVVTDSPVSYAPVDVGYSYNKPVIVKTPSIPVTPVTVVPAYQKVLNVVKATTTPAPVYVNHYTSTTPAPAVVSYHEDAGTAIGIDAHDYQGQLDLYESLKSEFGSKLQTYQHTSNDYQGYTYQRPKVRFEDGAFYQQNVVPQYFTSTTVAPVVGVKQKQAIAGYDASASLGGYNQDVYYSVQKPVVPVVKQAIAGYDASASLGGYNQDVYYSVQKPVVPVVKQAIAGYDASASLGGYNQDVYYSVQKPVVPVVKQFLQEVVPTTVVSTTPVPDFDVTTARVSLPVVKKVRVRPFVTTTTAYPTISTVYTPSTTSYTPSTVFGPSYYTSTPAPAVTISTGAPHPDDVLDVEGEEGYAENEGALLEAYNGQFGAVETHVSSTVASLEDGATIVGVLKKGKLTYNGKRTKSKVVVVSRLSDFNPILVGKLGAECSCRSNNLNLRRGKVLPASNELFSPNNYGNDYSTASLPVVVPELSKTYLPATTTVAPLTSVSLGDNLGDKLGQYANIEPVVEIRPTAKLVTTTTVLPPVVTGNPYSNPPTVAYQQPASFVPVSYVTDRTPRPTYQDVLLGSSISAAEIDGQSRVRPGKSFDRYGPGGWRSLDETLQGSVDCKRAGLFRHPKYCNKFYACNWDQWKGRFTLHVFNCPVHLAYDQQIGACNWPSKGPACADDNLLV